MKNQADRDLAVNAITRVLGQFENLYRNLGDVKNGFPKEIPLHELEGREQYDPLMLEENLMFGSPDTVIKKLKRYQMLGVDEFIYYASMGLDHAAPKTIVADVLQRSNTRIQIRRRFMSDGVNVSRDGHVSRSYAGACQR